MPSLDLIPDRTGSAAENMAVDFLMLQRYPETDVLRLRHYEWRHPAFTFGVGQKIDFIREQLPEPGLDLCRRPTGGGLVDHRDDWTYALAVPRSHELWDRPATDVYRIVHEALRSALAQGGATVELQRKPPDTAAGICFIRAEINDLVDPRNDAKVAGAAMKRNKHGLLIQGSIWRPCLPDFPWEDLLERLAEQLGRVCQCETRPVGWPEWDSDEEIALTEQFSSEAWIERR